MSEDDPRLLSVADKRRPNRLPTALWPRLRGLRPQISSIFSNRSPSYAFEREVARREDYKVTTENFLGSWLGCGRPLQTKSSMSSKRLRDLCESVMTRARPYKGERPHLFPSG